jgi:hypothetical protein
MAFEITVREALAILKRTRTELKELVTSGALQEFIVHDRRGLIVRRFLHYEEVVELARKLAQEDMAAASIPDRPSPRRQAVGAELLTILGAARLMDVSLDALHAMIDEGRLPVARTSRHGQLDFRRQDLIALIEARRASRCCLPPKGDGAPADELVDVPTAALLLDAPPVRVYSLVRKGRLQVAHVSADGARCFRREEVLALAGTQP